MNLNYSMRRADENGHIDHPQKVMRDMGITYEKAECFSISDCWVFYNCQNVPADLPIFLTGTSL